MNEKEKHKNLIFGSNKISFQFNNKITKIIKMD